MKKIDLFKPIKFKKKKFNLRLIVLAWLFTFILSSIGFALYTQNLTIDSKATIEGRIYELVRIYKTSIHETSGNAISLYYGHTDTQFNATASVANGAYITYKIDLINESPYDAYVTKAEIANFVNSVGASSSNHKYEIIDLIESSTLIPSHGTYSFYVKITGTGSGDPYVSLQSNYEYSLYKYFDFTLNSVPNDATIELTTEEGTVTGTGSVTHRVEEGKEVSWKVSRTHYYDSTGSYTMEYGDQSKTVTLEENPYRTITVQTTPADATVQVSYPDGTVVNPDSTGKTFTVLKDTTFNFSISATGYETMSGQYSISDDETVPITLNKLAKLTVQTTPADATVVLSYTDGTTIAPADSTGKVFYVKPGETFNYTISSPGYDTASGQYSISADETVPVTLTQKPWITGTYSNTSPTTAKWTNTTNYHAGYYLVEAWGGQGGQSNGTRGSSGYVYGAVYIGYGSSVYITAGGNGTSATANAAGGANGGGQGGTGSSNPGSGGGGYSAFVVGTTTISLDTIASGAVKLIAGGGGGSGGKGGYLGTGSGGDGGNGGSIFNTGTSITAGTVFNGSHGTSPGSSLFGGDKSGIGGGGTTTGGVQDGSGSEGSFLQGGKADDRGGGGGGGYYGGGGGSGNRIPTDHDYGPGGGGGGSSFVSSTVTWSGLSTTIASNLKGATANPSSTGGAIVITYIGTSL